MKSVYVPVLRNCLNNHYVRSKLLALILFLGQIAYVSVCVFLLRTPECHEI